MSKATETFSVDGTDYVLNTRLGWYDQQRVDQAGFHMFVEGRALSDIDDLSELEAVEMRMDIAQKNLMRLSLRLGIKPVEAKALPAHHVPSLLERIEQLEDEEEAEIEALKEGNPTGGHSDA